MRKAIILALFISLVIPAIITGERVNAQRANADPQVVSERAPAGSVIAPQVQATMGSAQDGETISVIVTLTDQADLSRIPGASRAARQQGVIRALQALANASQKQITGFLTARAAQGLVSRVDSFWVFNGLSVTATPEVIQELADRDDVFKITPDEIAIAPSQASSDPEPNLSAIGAPALWDVGLFGQGVVVANMDSGVDVTHPDLAARWRGGSNSWYDPHGQHSTPTDLSGHGTWTMGVMVGGNAGGTFIGVAPGAQWIAVKIFDDAGSTTATAIHQGFQWLLDPDGDPGTPDAPHVVNNSWTFAYPGCDLEFELDLQSLRAAGILPVFAAGNGGPNGDTSYSPSNNPAAFAVGATNNSDLVYADSGRGPSSCGEASTIYPELVAPGVAIRTTDLYGTYYSATGTSLAAPHVAGGLALLLSAYPDLTAAEQENALLNTAVDLGVAGPDNDFGYGRLDVWASYQYLLAGGPPPTPTPTPTATPDPNVNLALNRPVTVSSIKDDAHSGDKAVDGRLDTYWQTAKANKRNGLPSEWIVVDLGSSMSVGAVSLAWDGNYATSYTIQVSDDNNTWTTVFSTSSGDGGDDTISFATATARYIKMDSTAWSSSSQRNWLRELEIYAGGGSPPPTPTPPPTATPTPGATTTVHVGDLDPSSAPAAKNRWAATVLITVHDASHNAVLGATVSGTWSDGTAGSGSCVTDAGGRCSLTKSNIKGNVSSVVFAVDYVSHAAMAYQPSANHDPDGDSDGTGITIIEP